jgi:hypothetical protein
MNLKGDYRVTERDTVTLGYTSHWVSGERDGFMPDGLISGTSTLNATNTVLAYAKIFGPRFSTSIWWSMRPMMYGSVPPW